MSVSEASWENLGQLAGPEGILITSPKKPENQAFLGKRLSEIARMQNKDWRDAAMDLILTKRTRVEATYFLMSEENVRLQLQQPWMMIGTDGPGVDPEKMKGRLVIPRVYGTFSKILGRYVPQRTLGRRLRSAFRVTHYSSNAQQTIELWCIKRVFRGGAAAKRSAVERDD
jgi:N-acyl-D-aspartate/D-glutamate deacylase